MLRATVIAAAVALAIAPSAFAGGAAVAEVRGPDGTLLGQAGVGTSSYRNVLQIGSATTTIAGVELRDVSLLGGRIWVSRVFVPAHGLRGASISGLVVGGRSVEAATNGLLPITPRTYLVELQKAVLPGRRATSAGVVGLRAYIGDADLGVAPGTQVLVGLAHAALQPRHRPPHRQLAALVLGLDPVSVAVSGVPTTDLPLFPGPTSIGQRVVAIAEQFVGVPYVWAGASPGGFDCSGLTMYVYHQVGIDLTHYAAAQYNEGLRVPPDQLQPGDLVFFEPRSNGPNHVGIYIGGGRFLHAPHTGDVVKISSLADPSYALQYVGAVRPYVH